MTLDKLNINPLQSLVDLPFSDIGLSMLEEIYEHITLTGENLEFLRISCRDTPRTFCGFLFFLWMWCDFFFHGLFVKMPP